MNIGVTKNDILSKMRNYKNYLFVIAISALFTFLNSIQFFTASRVQPPHSVYLGTIHYYEDYFLYLNHFFQGAHGNWLVTNRYTSEATPPSIIYWSNLLLGKIGGLIRLSPVLSYNVSVIVLSFLVLITSYIVFLNIFPRDNRRALIGFIFSTFATSLINHIVVDGKSLWYPFQLWRTPHYAFDRLGGAPHQLLQTLFFLLGVLLFFQKDIGSPRIFFGCLLLLIALTTTNPVQAGLLILCLWITVLFSRSFFRSRIISLALLSIAVTITFLYTNSLLSSLPHLQSKLWEAGQETATTIPFLLASIGPIIVLIAVGILPSLKSKNPIYLFSIFLIGGCYALFLSPLPKLLGISNVRVIFPALYPFMGALAVNGAYAIAQRCKRKEHIVLAAMTLVFILVSLPTLRIELEQKLKPLDNPSDPVLFLPEKIYKGFDFLAHRNDYDTIILANPTTHMDVLGPALSGHTAYSGHPLATINNEEKRAHAIGFFSLQKEDAQSWLTTNTIGYVIFTKYDGDVNRFMSSYPFLKTLYTNRDVAIFNSYEKNR